MKRYLDYVKGIVTGDWEGVRAVDRREFQMAVRRIHMEALIAHSGGAPYSAKTKVASDSSAIASTGTEGGEAGAASSSDGDGDGDPDSDRRKSSRIPRSAHSASAQSATPKRILRMPAVQVRVGLSRSTIYEAIGRDEFPPSISLGARAVGWLESDIDAWLETRVLASKTFSVAELKPARIQNARTQSTKLSKE